MKASDDTANSAASPIEGQATLSPAQVADLMAGKWYANVHTAANKGGEIRGQIMPGMYFRVFYGSRASTKNPPPAGS